MDYSSLAVFIRWVDTYYTIFEDVICMVQVDQTDAATLASTLKDVLIRCGLQLSNYRGQTYDGATNVWPFKRGYMSLKS